MTIKFPWAVGTNLTSDTGQALEKLSAERGETVAATLRALVDEVFIVRYSSDGNPMKIVTREGTLMKRVNRSKLHEWLRTRGEEK